MPKGHPWRNCRNCGRPRSFRGEFTRAGYCIDCANDLQRDATLQLVAHDGPVFRHWQRQCARAFRYVNLDETRDTA